MTDNRRVVSELIRLTVEFHSRPVDFNNPIHVDKGLLVGNYNHVEKLNALTSIGVTHIINACASESNVTKDLSQFKMLRLDISQGDEGLLAQFADIHKFIQSAKDSGGKTFIFCFSGVNRSTLIACAYLMVSKQQRMLRTVEDLARRLGIILQIENHRQQLAEFAKSNSLSDVSSDVNGQLNALKLKLESKNSAPAIVKTTNLIRVNDDDDGTISGDITDDELDDDAWKGPSSVKKLKNGSLKRNALL